VRDERLLLERAREYDPEALGEIYDGYSEKIYHYIYRYLGEARLAEDLTAEVFLKLLEAIKASKGPRTHLSAWLYRVAHNLVVDHFRRRPQAESLPLEEELMAAPEDVTVVVEKKLAQQQLRAAISHLTVDQQQVIVLKFVEGLSNAEVGQVLGKTEGAVKSLQHRALAALQRIMEREESR
jgi:RNA polymerase sigma-70 factor (ECF subfamily)